MPAACFLSSVYVAVALLWLSSLLLTEDSRDPPLVVLFYSIGAAAIWPVLCLWLLFNRERR